MAQEKPFVVRSKNYSDTNWAAIPPETTHVRVTGAFTAGFYHYLLRAAPNISQITLSPSCRRVLQPAIVHSAEERNIVFNVDYLPTPTSPTQHYTRTAEYTRRKKILETMSEASKKRLDLLLHKRVVAAEMLVAYYGLSGSTQLNQRELLRRYPGYACSAEIGYDIAAVFLCLNPKFSACAKVRKRALKLYADHFAEEELGPFVQSLQLLQEQLQKLEQR